MDKNKPMTKEEVLDKLRELAKKLNKKVLIGKDIQTVPKLAFFLYKYYDHIKDALEDAGLGVSKWGERMGTSDEERLKNLYELGQRLGRIPRLKDIEEEWGAYKIYDKFKGVKKAYQQALAKFGSSIKIDKLDIKVPQFEYKGLFNGSAAEYFVISELLYWGFIAQKMPVDLGLDVFATKNGKTFFFQVKNVSFNTSNTKRVPIKKSAFQNNESTSVFYIFVIQKAGRKEALIIDYPKMRRLIKDKFFYEELDEVTMTMTLRIEGNSLFVIKKDNTAIREDVTGYLDDWDAIV